MKFLRVCLISFVLTLPLIPSARAGVTLVLKLDGIEGESQLAGHLNEIDIAEVSLSTEQTLALKEASKTGVAAGKAMFTPVTIGKGADKSSAMLFLRSVIGKSIKFGKISFLTQDDGPSSPYVEFFSISLGGILVSKFEVAASVGDNNAQEHVVLNYATILLNYKPPGLATPIKAGFDLVKNKEITEIPGLGE